MQCPRCGLQNLPDITACARCGLAVWQGPPSPPPGDARTGSPSVSGPAPSAPAPSGYGAGGYPAGTGYGTAAGSTSSGQGAAPQQYPSTGQSPSAPPPPYSAPYGTGAGSPYSTGPVAPYGVTAVLPTVPRDRADDSGDGTGALSRLVLLVGVLACLGYAIWALTARRGIFADFADNRSVSLDDARSSDRLDTVFLVVAAAIAVIALALWLIRLLNGRARSGAPTVAGFVISALGLACVVVGLVLSGLVGGDGSRTDEGRQAAAAAIVTGCGFIALALGLLIGTLVVARSRNSARANGSGDTAGAPAGW
ncbi:MAG: hypothetical protein ACR2JU_00960 [Nocardioidaceae bacterium]